MPVKIEIPAFSVFAEKKLWWFFAPAILREAINAALSFVTGTRHDRGKTKATEKIF